MCGRSSSGRRPLAEKRCAGWHVKACPGHRTPACTRTVAGAELRIMYNEAAKSNGTKDHVSGWSYYMQRIITAVVEGGRVFKALNNADAHHDCDQHSLRAAQPGYLRCCTAMAVAICCRDTKHRSNPCVAVGCLPAVLKTGGSQQMSI